MLAAVALAKGCGDGDGPTAPPPPEPARPATVTVSPATAGLSALGTTVQLTAEVRDQNASVMAGAAVTWSSGDASVATVDVSGLVTGVGEGTATITASVGSGEGTAEITVMDLERAALIALYEATDGPNWVNSDNWLTDAPLGDWYGVYTDADGRVVRLDLRGGWDNEAQESIPHGLSGSIPAELGNLASLVWLTLNLNDLMGPIPPEIGDLASLEELNLGDNDLTGPIPPEIGGLSNLERLYLGDNDLMGPIPPEIGDLASLEHLGLARNDLTGPIPPEIGDLASLTQLSLGDNDLTGPIPPEIGGLSNLERLYLARNDLTGPIPPEIGDLADLESLNLSFNGLTGTIPTELGGLASLTSLLLNDNDLEGSIPVSFSSLGRLQHLGLDAHHCAPADPQLQAWLRERNFLDPCDSKPPPNPHPDPDVLFGSTPSNVITVLDPTAYDSVVYVGRGIRRMRTGSGSQLDVNAFLFTAHFHDAELALEVHANYGNHEAAAAAARPYLAAMGRLPRVLITGSRLVQVSPEGGTAAQPCYRAYYWASPHGKHTEEVALHEGVHAALQDCPTGVHCPADCDGPTDLDDWAEAALADSIYISRYGRNHARNGRFYEDMADTFWAWFVSRCEPERLHPEFKRQIDENLPNRLAYFDGLHLDMHPWQCGETSRTANRSSTPRSWWMPDPRSPTPPVRIASPD